MSELPAMELPGEIATRGHGSESSACGCVSDLLLAATVLNCNSAFSGAYGPTPPTKAIDDEEKQEEEKPLDCFYIPPTPS